MPHSTFLQYFSSVYGFTDARGHQSVATNPIESMIDSSWLFIMMVALIAAILASSIVILYRILQRRKQQINNSKKSLGLSRRTGNLTRRNI